jgi:competence ComEA-like helix-hairpin-helix protein
VNKRERFVVLFLTATFLAGAGLNLYRRADLRRRQALSPIVIENPADSAIDISAALVNLNTARQYELEALPGIGPVIARRIIQFRERRGGFKTVGQLREVPGIGPKRFAALSGLVTVVPDSSAGEPDSLKAR